MKTYVFSLIALFIFASNSFGATPVPHLTSYCVGQMMALSSRSAQTDKSLYAIRDLRLKLLSNLDSVQAFRGKVKADSSPTYLAVWADSPVSTTLKDEVKLGRAVGRLSQLEKDVVDENPGITSLVYEIRGTENILVTTKTLKENALKAESDIKEKIDREFPYWSTNRKIVAGLNLFSTYLAVRLFGHGLEDLIFNHSLNLVEIFFPIIFRGAIGRTLTSIKALFSEDTRIADENKSFYRASKPMQLLDSVEGKVTSGSYYNGDFIYSGINLFVSHEFSESLIHINDSKKALIENQLKATADLRNHKIPTGFRFLNSDMFFYFDEGAFEPVLVVAIRIHKDFVLPTKPKKKKKEEAPVSERVFAPGGLIPLPAGNR